jgi:CelD/BcsL family acetyltransferase involved in cellulose biosynthesis
MDYTISEESFTSLEQSWWQILPYCTSNHVFFTPQWQRAWWQVFGSESQLRLLSVRQGTETVAVIPLRQDEGRITFIGGSDVCDYMDFIVRRGQEAAVFSRLVDYLENVRWDSIELESLLPDSLALGQLALFFRQMGYPVEVTSEDVSPELILPSSWEDYLSLLKRKDRQELGRKQRRLDRANSVRFYTVTEREQLLRELPHFFELFSFSRGEKANFMTGQRKEFFATVTYSLAEGEQVQLSFLEVDGVRAASVLCFDYNNEIYLYNSGYDPAYASLSVSLLLKVFCIRQGILKGRRRFDFLRGSESYKYHLGGREVPVYRCRISRSGHDARR